MQNSITMQHPSAAHKLCLDQQFIKSTLIYLHDFQKRYQGISGVSRVLKIQHISISIKRSIQSQPRWPTRWHASRAEKMVQLSWCNFFPFQMFIGDYFVLRSFLFFTFVFYTLCYLSFFLNFLSFLIFDKTKQIILAQLFLEGPNVPCACSLCSRVLLCMPAM